MSEPIASKKPLFILTLRNKKGQVGIFVALIFQVIFVFFAMLVNVGLLVHHKINLQQSTDLAAYYGAMKQAEMMNVMAHVNFQIRQAWKLLTWRYRVLGTFGMENPANPSRKIQYPVLWEQPSLIYTYNASSENFKCGGLPDGAKDLTFADTPFMCVGHNGFVDWNAPRGQNETFCRVDCGIMEGAQISIPFITGVGGFAGGGVNVGTSINNAINQTNRRTGEICQSLGPINLTNLGAFYQGYMNDVRNRRNFISMLAANLTQNEETMLDVEGEQVADGVVKTLQNNLTEANLASMGSTSISLYNGAKGMARDLLTEITFQRLQFFVTYCVGGPTTNANRQVSLKSVIDGSNQLDPDLVTQGNNFVANLGSQLNDVFAQNSEQVNLMGYEKNPWVNVYYGVKASTTPKIPFLPLARIKLNAVSFAKPFGGSIGPRYFKKWNSSDTKSDGPPTDRVDNNLPARTVSTGVDMTKLRNAIDIIPNFSNYIGDVQANASDAMKVVTDDGVPKAGVANIFYQAVYNAILVKKYEASVDVPMSPRSSKVNNNMTTPDRYQKPDVWPRFQDWAHLTKDVTDPMYDPLAYDETSGSPRNTYMRDIEITVVAPNQFDTTYYSIEPDFYENYGRDKLDNPDVINSLATAANMATAPQFPYDFGYNKNINISNIEKFAVRHQLQITHEFFREQESTIRQLATSTVNPNGFFFTFIPIKQGSLLTGWTFLDFKDFKMFPSPDADFAKYKMQFGTCNNDMNPWTDEYGSVTDIDNRPPVAGNCVTGGRTGYSVKLISSDMVKAGRRFNNLGGEGTSGEIKNPVDPNFLTF